jgi:hypothetical protein
MGGVFSAYLLTLGIVTYRWATGPKQPPPPISFLGASIVFGVTGLIAGADKRFGTALAWGWVAGALVAPKSNIVAVQRLGGVPAPDYGTGPDGTKTLPPSAYPNGSTTTSKPPFPGGPTQMPEPGQHIYGAPATPAGPPSSVSPPMQALPGPAPTPPANG